MRAVGCPLEERRRAPPAVPLGADGVALGRVRVGILGRTQRRQKCSIRVNHSRIDPGRSKRTVDGVSTVLQRGHVSFSVGEGAAMIGPVLAGGQGCWVGVEPDARVVEKGRSAQFALDRAGRCGDHRGSRRSKAVEEQLGFDRVERFDAVLTRDPSCFTPGGGAEHGIGVDEGTLEVSSKPGSDGGLAGSHHAEEHDVAG